MSFGDRRGFIRRALPLGLALACGCATPPADPLLDSDVAVETTPLGGEALALRKRELERAHRDLLDFHKTLDSLYHRTDREGHYLFAGFLDGYLRTHLEPLLEPEWQSQHAELQGIDASVRLLQAEALLLVGRLQQMQLASDEIERRFAGRLDILVDYPVGDQRTLGEALKVLRHRRWKGWQPDS